MFQLLELVGALFGLFEFAETATRHENRTFVRTATLLGTLALIACFPVHAGTVEEAMFVPLLAAQIAGGLLLITLLHAVRPVGEDLPERTWSETFCRCVGPLSLTALAGLFVAAFADSDADGAWQAFVHVGGGGFALLGLAAALRAARSPF